MAQRDRWIGIKFVQSLTQDVGSLLLLYALNILAFFQSIDARAYTGWPTYSIKPKALHDACVLAVVINDALGQDWVTKVESADVSGPGKDYSWQPASTNSTVRLIRDIDGEAMKADLFRTLNGNPSHLRTDAASPAKRESN